VTPEGTGRYGGYGSYVARLALTGTLGHVALLRASRAGTRRRRSTRRPAAASLWRAAQHTTNAARADTARPRARALYRRAAPTMPRRSTQYAETAEEENWDLDFDMFPDDASASGESEQDWPGNADAWSDGAQYTPLRTRARAPGGVPLRPYQNRSAHKRSAGTARPPLGTRAARSRRAAQPSRSAMAAPARRRTARRRSWRTSSG
jgi:hypothetical protein